MKIGIVTQPLHANYGGFLQAWALQEKLRKMGHDPQTIDYMPDPSLPWYILLRSWIKTLFLRGIGKTRPFAKRLPAAERMDIFESFVSKHMSLTPRIHSYKSNLVREYNFDAVITGSDQVWRPLYNAHLQDMFLRFVKKPGIKKIAYSCSFGVDNWEFTQEQTEECGNLAKRLDAISVRENSGIALCKTHLGVSAVEVLDPTLLHTKDDYEKLCADIPRAQEPFLASYVLDITPEKQVLIESIAQRHGLPLRIFSAHNNATLSIEEWLAIYRDATYVVTDSFHGTVFSILFHKPFLSIVNENRGASRFHSLVSKFELNNRLLHTLNDKATSETIDWFRVDEKLRQLRLDSTDFILKALYK